MIFIIIALFSVFCLGASSYLCFKHSDDLKRKKMENHYLKEALSFIIDDYGNVAEKNIAPVLNYMEQIEKFHNDSTTLPPIKLFPRL